MTNPYTIDSTHQIAKHCVTNLESDLTGNNLRNVLTTEESIILSQSDIRKSNEQTKKQ